MSKTSLTKCQDRCLDEVFNFIGSKTDKYFLIEGSAGTGKTFLINSIVKKLVDKCNIIVSAPTHNAVSIIKNNIDSNLKKDSFATIHKLLSMKESLCKNIENNKMCGEYFLTLLKDQDICESCYKKENYCNFCLNNDFEKCLSDCKTLDKLEYNLENLFMNNYIFDKDENIILYRNKKTRVEISEEEFEKQKNNILEKYRESFRNRYYTKKTDSVKKYYNNVSFVYIEKDDYNRWKEVYEKRKLKDFDHHFQEYVEKEKTIYTDNQEDVEITKKDYLNLSKDFKQRGLIEFDLNYERIEKKVYSENLLIIDECSMLDNDILSILFNYINKKNSNIKVIFVGDKKQLPPVNITKVKNIIELESPVFNKIKKGFTLKEIVRQSKDNPILELVDNIDNLLDCELKENKLNEKKNGYITINKEESLLKIIKGLENNYSILSYRNDVMKYFLKKSREILYQDKWRDIQPKETINIKGMDCYTNDYDNIFSINNYHNLDYIVDSVSDENFEFVYKFSGKMLKKWRFNVKKIKCYREDDKTYFYFYNRVENFSNDDFNNCIKDYYTSFKDINLELEFYKIYINEKQFAPNTDKVKETLYYLLKKFISNINFNNSRTIHSTQGRTIDYVFINLRDIIQAEKITSFFNKDMENCKEFAREFAKKLLYTAITRASKGVILDTTFYEIYNKIKNKYVYFDNKVVFRKKT